MKHNLSYDLVVFTNQVGLIQSVLNRMLRIQRFPNSYVHRVCRFYTLKSGASNDRIKNSRPAHELASWPSLPIAQSQSTSPS